ncbi:hypothetical protein GOFOIKOB_0043 [Methylobacterium tardum]|nr:Rap1a/Tai family immunity protein [Methylobacterium tardum]URD36627.1 hypothetical protein M6G65_30565 [Methylobacterium tardum]GJE47024.1 hypothetical protein GOFOIKOB_0043 [Methylobacterium tardum]
MVTMSVNLRQRCLAAVVAASVAASVPPASAAGCEGTSCAQDQGAGAPAVPPSASVDIRERRSGDLYRVCLAERGEASGWCSAYLMGVADTLAAFGDGGDKAGICAADYTIEALTETYMTWAHANAALLRTDMLAGASLALRQRWPCGR